MSAPVTPYERTRGRGNNLVFKSGPLFISSKGLGWKSWKRRWFILTRTSLVFFKSDPNVLSQKGNELNLTLGGIDLSNSGSVLVRADKKLLTVLFPDGRAFTLKAETSEDLEEWKAALERALAAAPNAALVIGQNGIFRNDSIDATEGPSDPGRDRRPVKSLVVGRPILLALEDIDGSPSFLEKALCFIEQYGINAEGILRQSADVDEVEQRIHDYEQGRNQFSADEDAHVVGDCIKHVLRELPSSPVPTPCCTAILEAYRVEEKEARIEAMRLAIAETFPEPNRRLLQRVLQMMRTVALHTIENRMTASAVAACMAPLLLRPLLAGECGLEDDTDTSGDNAAQLLAAAAAANNAQAIITTLLEEYNNIFEDNDQVDAPSHQIYAAIEDGESEGSSDGVLQMHDNGYHDAQNDLEGEFDEDPGQIVSGALSLSSGNVGSDAYEYKVFEDGDSEGNSPKTLRSSGLKMKKFAKEWSRSLDIGSDSRSVEGCLVDTNNLNVTSPGISCLSRGEVVSPVLTPRVNASNSRAGISSYKTGIKSESSNSRRTSIWGFSSVTKKKLSASATDSSREEELAIQRLEITRNELRARIAKEVKGNAILQASLERRKQALHERRMALEQEVSRLQEQLQAERDLRAALEIGLSMSTSQFAVTHNLDSITRAELQEVALAEADVARLKQKVAELHSQLRQHHQQHGGSLAEITERYQRVKSLQAQQKVLQQELDLTFALCQHEKQRNTQVEEKNGQDHALALEEVVLQQKNALTEAKEALKAERVRGMDLHCRAMQHDSVVGNDWRMLRPPTASSASSRQIAWRNRRDSQNPDSRKTDAIVTYANDGSSLNEFGSLNGKRSYMDLEVSNGGMYQRQGVASSALVELTSKLDFFKERRSQLMEQLQNLDLTLAPSLNGHDVMYS